MEPYTYIFVRTDISREQQLVQSGHVACVLGRNLPADVDPQNLYFVVIGSNDILNTMFYLEMHNIDFVKYRELDLNNEITAIATMPLRGSERNRLKDFKTLTFDMA